MNGRVLLVGVLLMACTETNQDQETPPGGCEPGEEVSCVCAGGEEGAQTCLDDRTYGACACGDGGVEADEGVEADGGDPSDAATPDAGTPDSATPDAQTPDVSAPDEGVPPDQSLACEEGTRQIGPCGAGGERTRECVDGAWGPWSDCVETCEDGVIEIMPCGLNGDGEARRECADGAWSAWGECQDEDVCVDGARQDEACGANESGTQSRTCEGGQWGAFGACEGADECANGAREGRGCGLNDNGREERTCADGQWGEFGECADPDECRNGAEDAQACGIANNGERVRTCEDGRWTPFGACDDPDRQCDDGTIESVPCGLNNRGRRSHTCEGNRWGPFGPCEDPDECVDDAIDVEACGLNGNGERERGCRGGQWRAWSACADPDECRDGDEERRACGANGRETRTCGDGRWSEFGECEDEDECRDGMVEERDCPQGGSQLRTCLAGVWLPWIPCGAGDQIRPNLLLCGESDRDVEEFIRGPLVERVRGVQSGCQPDEDTQAILVTRNGANAAIRAEPEIRDWIIEGGVLVTEWNNSHPLYNAFFGTAFQRGRFRGNCGNSTMPVAQQNPDDPLWQSVPFNPPEGQLIGCGYDLSDLPDIEPLGGWDEGTVSLAYRPLGLGRIWLAESDWQDEPDRAPEQHEPSMDLMAEMIAEGHRRRQRPTCWDGLDNDEDGWIDSLDRDCEARDDDEDGERPQCADDEQVCGGECVDVSRDERHCGDCDQPCDGFCNGARCVPAGDFIWRGIRRDVEDEQIVGWDQCYAGLYADDEPLGEILTDCDQRRILFGCRPAGSDRWTVMAMGLREVLLDDAPNGAESRDHNGARFYFSAQQSIGFAPEGARINLNSCDTAEPNDPERMCWHTANDRLQGGWRCGATTGLNGSRDWERAIWTRP